VTDNNQDIFTQELRASSRGEGPLKRTIGAFYLDTNLDGGQVISSPAFFSLIGVPDLGDLQSRGNQTEVEGFGETTYTLANKWDLTAGVRVSNTSLKSTTDSTGVLLVGSVNPADVVSGTITQHSTNADPRFSLAYRADLDITLYATISRGHRVGGPNLTAGLGGPGIPTSRHPTGRTVSGIMRLASTISFSTDDYSSAAIFITSIVPISRPRWSRITSITWNAGSAGIYGGEFEGVAKPGPAPFWWTVYRLSLLTSSLSKLFDRRSLPPKAVEALGFFT